MTQFPFDSEYLFIFYDVLLKIKSSNISIHALFELAVTMILIYVLDKLHATH